MSYEQKLRDEIQKICPIDREMCRRAEKRWNEIGKPLGSLGRLEEMVVQLAGITRQQIPCVDKKAVLIFCADNGVVAEGVTQTGQKTTAAVARNFARGIATVNAFARVLGADSIPIDIGIHEDVSEVGGLVHEKVAPGTRNMARQAAMTREECAKAVLTGIEQVKNYKKKGYQLFMTGEMGIGNTTTSSAVLSVLLGVSPKEVTGRGAGLSKEGVRHKIQVIEEAIKKNAPDPEDVLSVLSKVGGFDLCGITGAFLGGAIYQVPVIVDGFISAVAANCAIRLSNTCREYMFASHVSAEPAGSLALQAIGMEPYLSAGMCLGEGTGAVIGAGLFDYALAAYKEVVEFSEAEYEHYQKFD